MITKFDYEGMEAIRLSNGKIELVILPEIGGKIVSLKRVDGGEWMWRNPYLPQLRAVYGESFVELHDTGGWDECFPSTNPCTLPDGVKIPDHGELVTQTWQILEATSEVVRLSVEGVRLPFRFERTILLKAEGFEVNYRATNLSDQEIPFLWCCHPLIAIEPGMTIELGGSPRGRLSIATRQFEPCEFVWPNLAGFDLTTVPESTNQIGLKSFVGPLKVGNVSICGEDEKLTMTFDLEDISHVAFWMNYGAWSGCGSEPYFNLGVEPCIGPFDALDEAIASGRAPKIGPGEAVEWSLKISIEQMIG